MALRSNTGSVGTRSGAGGGRRSDGLLDARRGAVESVLVRLQERRDGRVDANSERVGDLEDVLGRKIVEREHDVQALLEMRKPVAALPVRQRPLRDAEPSGEVVLSPFLFAAQPQERDSEVLGVALLATTGAHFPRACKRGTDRAEAQALRVLGMCRFLERIEETTLAQLFPLFEEKQAERQEPEACLAIRDVLGM